MKTRHHVVASFALLLSVSSCASPRREALIDVVGSDFAFVAPDSADPGPTRFRFQRSGTVAHEVAIGRVKQGVPLSRVLAAEASGSPVDSLYDEGDGLLYADISEHTETELLLDLAPGRQYVLMCTLEKDGKPHTMLGMVKGLTVRAR